MMRLQRVGRKNDPSFRVVVTDKRTGPKSNKSVDILGSYDPKQNRVQLDAAKAKDWLSKGVQPSETVHNILVSEKVIDAKKVNVLPRKSPIVSEEAQEGATASAESATAATVSEEVKATEGSEDPAPSSEGKDDTSSEAGESGEAKKADIDEGAVEPKEEAAEAAPAEADETAAEVKEAADEQKEEAPKEEEAPAEAEETEEDTEKKG